MLHQLAHLLQHGLGLLHPQPIGQDHGATNLTVVLLGNEGPGPQLQGDAREQQTQQQQGHQGALFGHHPIQPAAVGGL